MPKIEITKKAIIETFKQKLNEIVDHFTFEANTLATREAIKYQVENLLEEARQQYIREGKIVADLEVPCSNTTFKYFKKSPPTITN